MLHRTYPECSRIFFVLNTVRDFQNFDSVSVQKSFFLSFFKFFNLKEENEEDQ